MPNARIPKEYPARSSPSTIGSRLGHVPELDGIRGVAVGLVLLVHLWPNVGWWRVFLPFTDSGWLGVDLFFALSGFLITGILLDTMEGADFYSRFYARRFFRIFPLYYATLLVIFGFLKFWHQGTYLSQLQTNWGSPIWFFVYLANQVRPRNPNFASFAPLAPTWSLQIEEQFYLLFPFVVRQTRHKVWIVLVALIVASFSWRVFVVLVNPMDSAALYSGTLSRIDSLAAGGLASYLFRYGSEQFLRKVSGVAALFLVSALFVMYVVLGLTAKSPFSLTVGYSLNSFAFATLILWTVYARSGRRTALLRTGPLRLLGKISYGTYLLQLPVQSALKIIMGTPLGPPERQPIQCLFWFVSVIAVALISWKLFEKPILDWGTRLTGNKSSECARQAVHS